MNRCSVGEDDPLECGSSTQGAGVRDQTGIAGTASSEPDSGQQPASGEPFDGDADSPTELIPVADRDDSDPGDRRNGLFGGRSRGFIGAVVAGAVLLVLAVVYLVDLLATSGEIERNTTVAGIEVGGMTPEQAATTLTEQALPAYGQPMTVDVHG